MTLPKPTTLQPTITISNEREINEVTLSSKDLQKAGKDQGDHTRKVNPPLSDAELDVFIYVLALLAPLVSVTRPISTQIRGGN